MRHGEHGGAGIQKKHGHLFHGWFYAAYLHMRISKGWQGRRPAILASTGFLVVLVCYLGVNFLGIGLHSYGWIFG